MSNYIESFGNKKNRSESPKRKKYNMSTQDVKSSVTGRVGTLYVVVDENWQPVRRPMDASGERKPYATEDKVQAEQWLEMLRRENLEDLKNWQSLEAAFGAASSTKSNRVATSLRDYYGHSNR